MSPRIHSIGGGTPSTGSTGSTGSTTPVTAATVTIGPDWGTTNQKVEEHLSYVSESNAYPMTEEIHIDFPTRNIAWKLTEELHIDSVEKPIYPTFTEELHLSVGTEQATYPMKEELSVRPSSFTATYPMTEELSLQESQTQTIHKLTEEEHLSMSSQSAAYPITEEIDIAGEQVQIFPKAKEELHISGTVNGPPQFESIVVKATTATTLCALTGASTIIGQFLLAVVGFNLGSTVTPPAGWTEIRNTTNASQSLGSFYRIVVAGDPSSWTFTNPFAGSANTCGVIMALTAVDAGTPVNGSNGSTGSSTVLSVPSVTATKTNVMCVPCGYQNLTAGNPAFVTPSPYVVRSTQQAPGAVASGNSWIATHIQATSGATGTVTVNTGEVTGGAWMTQMIVLNSTARVIA